MTRTISAANLRKFSTQVFEASGINSEDAARAADVLIWASLRGVDTHGIRNLKRYYIDSAAGVGRRDGVIIPNAPLTTDRDSETTAALNAHGGLGLSVSSRAMELTIDKARQHGVGIVTVRNSTHFGPAGYYAHMAVEHDMIGFAATGYFFPHGQEKAVVPFGGLLGLFSTNPLAMACPAERYPPFLLDMSTSIVPVNRIEMLEELGKRVPLNWALNRDHQPTDDPAEFTKVVPLGGATEYGGHKGHGLMLAGWILTGLLSGAWRRDPAPDRVLGTCSDPRNGFAQEGIGHIFAAVRLDQFGDPTVIRQGLDSMIQTLNESPPAPGFDRVLAPGQPEHQTLLERTQHGIPLAGAPLDDLLSLEKEFQVRLELDPVN